MSVQENYRKLCSGEYPITIEEVLNFEEGVELPAARDYYQTSQEPGSTPQVLIRAGSDLSKRKRSLKRLTSGKVNPLAKETYSSKLTNSSGIAISRLHIKIDQGSEVFLKSMTRKVRESLTRHLSSSTILAALSAQSSRQRERAFLFLNQLLGEYPILLLTLGSKEEHLQEFFQQAEITILCLVLSQEFELEREEMFLLGRACLLSLLDDFSSLNESGDLVERGQNIIGGSLNLLDQIGLANQLRKLFCERFETLGPSSHVASRILQTCQVMKIMLYGGDHICGEYHEKVIRPLSLSQSVARLLYKSIPQANMVCEKPVFESVSVNKLCTALGFGFLVDREKTLQDSILKKCPQAYALLNRASIVCKCFDPEEVGVQAPDFCRGQGSQVTVSTESGVDLSLSKCNQGCDVLSKINAEFSKSLAGLF